MQLHKKRFWSLIGLLLPTLLLLLATHMLVYQPLQAAKNATQLHFEPALIDLAPGKAVTVTVHVADVQGLYGLEFDVLYDPQRVTIKSIAPGNFLSADFVVTANSKTPGIATLAYTQLAPNQSVNGSGPVAVLVLEPTNCLFATTLQLRNSVLSDSNGVAIPHGTAAGAVQNANTGGTRKLAGVVFHDEDSNGVQNGSDLPLESWPVFAQTYLSVSPPPKIIFSEASGAFQFDNLPCGTYEVWSKNGPLTTPSQTIPLLSASDTLTVSVPITGALEYPFARLFLPGIVRSDP